MTDSTDLSGLDDDGTPMGEAEPIVQLPFAAQHHDPIRADEKTATLRVDHSTFATPGRIVELTATETGEVIGRRTITTVFYCRAWQARQMLETCDGARHGCLDTDEPINEVLQPYYSEAVTPSTVVQGIVWSPSTTQ